MEMRITVQDHKVHLLKTFLEDLPYVTIEFTKEQVLQDLDEAVKNIKLVQAGKLQATPIEELLDAV
jgi:hypothetical protein